jgi:hypothetical protein
MRSLLDSEREREREEGRREHRIQNGLPCTKSKAGQIWARENGRDSELDPSLAWVRREQKAASKDARFGAHFTQMYRFSAFALCKARSGTGAILGEPKPEPIPAHASCAPQTRNVELIFLAAELPCRAEVWIWGPNHAS